MMPCRILPHEVGDGPGNMAIDEALLHSIAEQANHAVFRTYTWIEPTLSLGYFQPFARSEGEPRWQGAPLVRRPTGGGALWHHHEITYAVVVPRSHPLSQRSVDLYRAVHAAIAGLLRSSGLDASRRGLVSLTAASPTKPFLCFSDRDAEDVVVGTDKIVGSAQRRRVGAVLQHGSLLLSRSPVTSEFPGAADLARVDSDPLDWSARLASVVPAALGLTPVDCRISAEERGLAHHLATEVYRNPAWTRKR